MKKDVIRLATLTIFSLLVFSAYPAKVEFTEKGLTLDRLPEVRKKQIKNDMEIMKENFRDDVTIHLSSEHPERRILLLYKR
jgi:hypothetical protein